MRNINVNEITEAVRELCLKANTELRPDIRKALTRAMDKETNSRAKGILRVLLNNADVAKSERRAICQDTGFVSLYIELGQDVRLVGGDLEKAVQKGVEDGYNEYYLRKSVVKSPLIRTNTKTNTPAAVETRIVPGERIKLTVVPKGFGSENKNRIKMLNPTNGVKEIISFVLEAVKDAGADACPPYILGIGLGGTFDKAASLSKRALTIPLTKQNPRVYLRSLEKKVLDSVNRTGIGPMGLGGRTTCLGVRVMEYPTHIAGLPVAVSVGCHATRSASKTI